MAIEYRNVRTVRNIRLCLSINISAVHWNHSSLVTCRFVGNANRVSRTNFIFFPPRYAIKGNGFSLEIGKVGRKNNKRGFKDERKINTLSTFFSNQPFESRILLINHCILIFFIKITVTKSIKEITRYSLYRNKQR